MLHCSVKFIMRSKSWKMVNLMNLELNLNRVLMMPGPWDNGLSLHPAKGRL